MDQQNPSSQPRLDAREICQLYPALIDQLPDGFIIVDIAGRIRDVNHRFAELTGFSSEVLRGMHLSEIDLEHGPDLFQERINDILGQGSLRFMSRLRGQDGSVRPVEVLAGGIPGQTEFLFALVHDLSAQEAEEQSRRDSAKRYQALRESTSDGFVMVNGDGAIVEVNNRYCTLSGRSQAELLRCSVHDLDVNDSPAQVQTRLSAIRAAGALVFETQHRLPDGTELPVEVAASYSPLDGGSYFCFVRDISERLRHRQALEFLAYHDELTGLPNQRALLRALDERLLRSQRLSQRLGVCYLDLDHFSQINAAIGQEGADRLLKAVAEGLRAELDENAFLARVGGDEFAIVLSGFSLLRDLERQIRRLLDALICIPSDSVKLTASCGVTVFPEDEGTADQLLRNAYHALCQAKRYDRNHCLRFDPKAHQAELNKRELTEQLRDAMHAGQLRLYLQPRVHLDSAAVMGAEVLLRWQHPARGLLLPGAFLPAIKGSELEIELDHWVLEQALQQQMVFREQGLDLPLSVNVSPALLQRSSFLGVLQRLLQRFPDDLPSKLELEVLETTAIDNTQLVASVMNGCRALGVSFALDDFGTGYASLSYFHRLPIQVLKIDQRFVSQMLLNSHDQDIVEGVLRLAEAVDRPVVAEGVESAEIALLLYQMGCRMVQGYGIARPMPAASFPAWQARWQVGNFCHQLRQTAAMTGLDRTLRVALFSHQCWQSAFKADLSQGSAKRSAARSMALDPGLATEDCQLSIWLQGIGKERFGRSRRFASVCLRHAQLHQYAAQLMARVATASETEVTRSLVELDQLNQDLEDELRALD